MLKNVDIPHISSLSLLQDDVAVFSFPPSPVPFLIRLLASMSGRGCGDSIHS